ncbi:MAG: ribose-phosphate diphosphokinase [Candidatus Heimdallarchaeota archaeon]
MEKVLIVGPGSQILGVKIANELGIPAINTEFKNFPDGENYLRVNIEDKKIIEDNEVIIVHSTGPSSSADQNKRLFELFMIINSIKLMKPKKIIVVVPYLAYARQDKAFRIGECPFGEILVKILNSFDIDEFYTVDIHNPEILRNFSCKVININSMEILADYIKSLKAKDIVVISPDKGAIERSKAFAKHFGDDIPVEYFEKERDLKTGSITMTGQFDLNNKDVVIADDIISTGGTMAEAIKILKKSGAHKIYAAATHALMLQQAKFRILKAGADDIIGTDSIDNELAKVSLAKVISKHLIS